MPSAIGWLDYSSKQQTQMREIISLFTDSDARDELGLASLRDAISDLLFPGISTIQTRARYFLFLPWIYIELERRRTAPDKFAELARKLETDLIRALEAGGENEGVIGIEARENLKRLPDSVYWNGLSVFGIRDFDGDMAMYRHSLQGFYRRRDIAEQYQTGEDDQPTSNWDLGLPAAPEGFLQESSFVLGPDEADYLKHRFVSADRSSLLAAFVLYGAPPERTDFPWDAPPSALSAETQRRVDYARFISETMWGAALLYNLMLAEKRLATGSRPDDQHLVDRYEERLSEFVTIMVDRADRHDAVDLEDFWSMLNATKIHIPFRSREFVTAWVELVRSQGPEVWRNDAARELVAGREMRHKGAMSRLANARQLDLWSGAAGAGRMDYRWSVAWTMLVDVTGGTPDA